MQVTACASFSIATSIEGMPKLASTPGANMGVL